MINDPKSTQFIAWTELGTSFVVSNVGEFSRSILGSHFKHNNVSLNFYLCLTTLSWACMTMVANHFSSSRVLFVN